MSIANKLIYLNTTKEKLKESINNIGGSITNETTFRNYVTELDNIYTNLPKTTGEGSNLSLTTIKGRINVDDIKGNTTQEGTPTPDSPQPINVVTGQQEVLVRGKNLFDRANASENIGLKWADGQTFTASTTSYLIGNYMYLGGITQIASNYNFFIFYYDKDKNYLGQGPQVKKESYGGYVKTTTIPYSVAPDICYARIEYRPQDNNSEDMTTKQDIMLNIGTTASAWQPYQEQTKIVNLSSKNLLGLTNGTYSNNEITAVVENGTITLNGTASGTSFVSIPLVQEIALSNSAITLSTNNETTGGDNLTEIRVYTSGSSYLACSYNTINNSVTYTNKADTYLRLQIRTSSGVSYNNFVLKPQLEYGSSATTYEPYYNYELAKIGTYQDRIFETSGKNLFNYELFNAFTTSIQYVDLTLEPNTTYTMSTTLPITSGVGSNLFFMLGGETASSSTNGVRPDIPRTLTTDSTGIVRVGYRTNTGVGENPKTTYIYQIEKGTTATTYEPYGSDKWYVEKNNIEKDKEYLVAQVGQVDTITNYARIRVYLNDACISTPTGLCSHLKFEASYSGQSNHFYVQGNYAYLIVDKTLLSTIDVTGAKTYLNTLTGLKILYPLATPTYEEITNETLIEELNELEKIMSYNGTTNINISGNLPMLVSVSALKGE